MCLCVCVSLALLMATAPPSFPFLSLLGLGFGLWASLPLLSTLPYIRHVWHGSNPYIWPCDADGHGPVLIYAPMWGGWAWDDWTDGCYGWMDGWLDGSAGPLLKRVAGG